MKPFKLSAPLAAGLVLVACQPGYYGYPYHSRYGVPAKPTTIPATSPPSPSLASSATYNLQSGGTVEGAGTSVPRSEGGGKLVLYDGTARFEQGNIKAGVSRTLSGVQPTVAPGFGYPNGAYYYQQTGTTTPSFELERLGPALGLKASDFGAWAQIDINKGNPTNSGFYAGGSSTAKLSSASAETGAAVYFGSYIGRLREGNATQSINGSMLVQADHNNNTVTVIFMSGSLATQNLVLAPGQISGGTYTASYTGSGDHPVQYMVKGQFYQDSGNSETTGTLSGSLGEAGELNGAFGART